ncbi:MAG: hypothetical protein HYX69_21030 [Planctomycetia bacterium]|nr:hypothetical protein [Planctomycetia bacterium]
MDTAFLLALLFRWMHILASITAVGGSIFMWAAVLPAAASLSDAERTVLADGIRSRWAKWVAGAILFLLVSGLYSFFTLNAQSKLPPAYHMLFGIKFVLALGVFALASLLVGRSAAAQRIRVNARAWLTLNLILMVTVVCIAGVMRTMHGTLKSDAPPAAADARIARAQRI